MNINPTFYQHRRPDMTGWYYFEQALSQEEIQAIEELANTFAFVSAGIASGAKGDDLHAIRKSNIKWLSPVDDFGNGIARTHWLYEKLMTYIEIANDEMWQFDLTVLNDSIQYTVYDGTEKGFYDWHLDIGPDELALRKVSLVVQLSDPTDYEGGELQIQRGKFLDTPTKTKGSIILFPSYLLHRVTPVTSGIRKSLVLWAGGKSLK